MPGFFILIRLGRGNFIEDAKEERNTNMVELSLWGAYTKWENMLK